MLPEEEVERPTAVTVIGWIWLVLALFSFMRSIVNLVLWKMIGPAVPSLLGAVSQEPLQNRFLSPVFEHFTTVMTVQAILSVALGFSAWQLLRLREWARMAIQAIGWLALAYVACFSVLWAGIWTRASAWAEAHSSASAPSHQTIGLVAGLGICTALAAGLITMIAFLRSEPVRVAFTRSP